MELIFKVSAAAVAVSLIILVIKRQNPELSTLLSLTAVVIILMAALPFLKELKDLIHRTKMLSSGMEIYISTMMKCLAISIVTKVSTELCKDANQAALSSAVELAGTICALSLVLPLVLNMLSLIGEMV